MDTPTELTPPSEDSSTVTPVKKSRRQVAFYPNMNNSNKPMKPFSRSAAKRESVMALGSIDHLQHYFTKSGIAAESNPLNKSNNGMVPAIGGLAGLRPRSPGPDIPELLIPPTPIVPEIIQPAFSPHVKAYEVDPENLRPTVIEDLSTIEHAWGIRGVADHLSADDAKLPPSNPQNTVDILDVLKSTTRAVRSVRNYILSIPDDTLSPHETTFRNQRFLKQGAVPVKRRVSRPDSSNDPLSHVRRSALEVLTVLRILEESSRLPLTDDAYDAQSDHGEQASNSGSGGSGTGGLSRGSSPDFLDADADTSFSFMRVGNGLKSVPVWEDEDSFDFNAGYEEEHRERWDEKLVLGGGWLYRQDITRQDLSKEREVVSRYLDSVDEVLFGGTEDGKRGWDRERMRQSRSKGRRSSSGSTPGDSESPVRPARSNRRVASTGILEAMQGMSITEEPTEMDEYSGEESVVDDDELPEWAKRSTFEGDPLARAHALLGAFLPSTLKQLLPPAPVERSTLLVALASGQLLCTVYNSAVRKSRKPWGFISKEAIHDVAALESSQAEESGDKGKKGWTFRRTDNLRLWGAALKLRYLIPVLTTNPSKVGKQGGNTPVPSPTPSMQRFPTTDPPIVFDAPVVARQDPGWEDMLEAAVLRWVHAVVDEKRGER